MDQAPASNRRARLVPLALAGIAVAFLCLSLLTFLQSSGWGYDFEAYYLAALRLAHGGGGEIYLQHTYEQPFQPGPYALYLYAPPLAAVLLPFTSLSLDAATLVWFGLRVLVLALACAIMPVRPGIRLLAFASAATSAAVLIDLNLGNVSVIVTALLAVTWRWLDRPVGSVALAVAMSVRPTLGLVIVWSLLRRAWKPVVWTILAGLAIVALSIPVVGWTSYVNFFAVLRNLSELTGAPNNLDLGTTMLRPGFGPMVATTALFAGYAFAIIAVLASLRYDREVGFMVTIGASLLLAPLLWIHYLAGLVLPAALLAQRGRTWALLLPLLTWLPPVFMPFLAIVATLVPFLVARRPQVAAQPTPLPVEPQTAAGSVGASNTTASPG
jgi:hypothetical protein